MVFPQKVLLVDLFCETERFLRNLGYRKGTIGTYKATWHKFLAYSWDESYDRTICEKFLLSYFCVDVSKPKQPLDRRMRGALRHMNALDEFIRKGTVSRKNMRCHGGLREDGFDRFFLEYLKFRQVQANSDSWEKSNIVALKMILLFFCNMV